jgi:hypothetical protein
LLYFCQRSVPVLGKNISWGVNSPIGEKGCLLFREIPLIKDEEELTAIRSQALE